MLSVKNTHKQGQLIKQKQANKKQLRRHFLRAKSFKRIKANSFEFDAFFTLKIFCKKK